MILSTVIWPIVAALWGAFDFVHVDSLQQVHAVNQTQKTFIERYVKDRSMLDMFNKDELRTWVSDNADYLNNILKQEGFSIQLEQFSAQTFGVVSILDILVHWLHEGQKTTIIKNNATYDAFELKKGINFYQLDDYAHPVIAIQTKNEDTVWVTVADQKLTEFELFDKVVSLRNMQKKQVYTFGSAVIPMIHYDQQFQLNWLLNLDIKGWFISQALQQTKFKMNEKGAHVKSAVAIAVTRSMPIPLQQLIIDKPFYVWIERKGLPYPIFTGYMDELSWQNPGNLDL
jgi:hypothetical protein